jgi:hypothetical protein
MARRPRLAAQAAAASLRACATCLCHKLRADNPQALRYLICRTTRTMRSPMSLHPMPQRRETRKKSTRGMMTKMKTQKKQKRVPLQRATLQRLHDLPRLAVRPVLPPSFRASEGWEGRLRTDPSVQTTTEMMRRQIRAHQRGGVGFGAEAAGMDAGAGPKADLHMPPRYPSTKRATC